MTEREILRIRRLVVRLGEAMHAYGTPSHRLERLLLEVSQSFGLEGSFLVSPTWFSVVLQEPGQEQEYSHISRVKPGGIDLNRLSLTHDLVAAVLAGRLGVEDGLVQLAAIRDAPDPYPLWLGFLSWGGVSAGFAMLCGSGLTDVLASMIGGWLVFGLERLAARHSRFEEMLEPLSALLLALLGTALVASGLPLNVPVVVLSGIIVFIPGLSMTMGLRELAARELLSGTARIMDALMTLFKLYFGAVFGLALGGLLWSGGRGVPLTGSLPLMLEWMAVLLLALSLLVMFRVRPRDAFWGLLCGLVAYGGARMGNALFGADLGGLVGAMLVGLYANGYARLKNTPANIVLLPGIVLLVPGSKVYMGLNSLVSGQDMLVNAASGAQVFLSFMSIVAGLMFANLILPPRRYL